MSEQKCYVLKIDPEFKNLIPPLTADEYQQLEQNLINEGCREPISIWNGYILDGHNRYEICTKRDIPFQLCCVDIQCREEAISWICANQLGRRNISLETRKYLIGKRYESEKIMGTPNAIGSNQYARKVDGPKMWDHPLSDGAAIKTASRLGNEYHISHATVSKYGVYSQALDVLAKSEPDIVPRILSGQVKISHENVVELSKLSGTDAKQLVQKLSDEDADFVGYSGTRNELLWASVGKQVKRQIQTASFSTGSIKNMPAYDPDAEISSFVLTIPSWVSSIDRTRRAADLNVVSSNARSQLLKQLTDLKKTIEGMLAAIREDKDNG